MRQKEDGKKFMRQRLAYHKKNETKLKRKMENCKRDLLTNILET